MSKQIEQQSISEQRPSFVKSKNLTQLGPFRLPPFGAPPTNQTKSYVGFFPARNGQWGYQEKDDYSIAPSLVLGSVFDVMPFANPLSDWRGLWASDGAGSGPIMSEDFEFRKLEK